MVKQRRLKVVFFLFFCVREEDYKEKGWGGFGGFYKRADKDFEFRLFCLEREKDVCESRGWLGWLCFGTHTASSSFFLL